MATTQDTSGMTPITEDEEDFESVANLLQKRSFSTVTLDYDGVQVIERIPKTKEEEEADYDTDLEPEEEKQDFDLSGRNMYLSTCKTLGVVPASYFLRHMKDSVLSLGHHGLAAMGAKALAYPLMNNTSVLKLDLSDNWVEGEGAEAIAHMLKENCYISNLDLSENHLGSRGAAAICNMLTINTTLKEIHLSGNHFNDDDAPSFAEALNENNRLKHLDLSHNEFSDRSGAILGPAVGENETLEELDLSWNYFRRNSIIVLSEGIAVNCRLREVNLSMNGFDNEGAFAIADIIKRNTTLLQLDVSYNRVGAPGAQVIAKAFESNDSLKVLKIGHNPLGVEGAKMLLKGVFVENCAITDLDMSCVEVDKEFRELNKELQTIRSINVTHGLVLSDYVIQVTKRHPAFPVSAEDISGSNVIPSIRQYCDDNSIKIGDTLINIDKNKDNKVTVIEFMDVLKSLGVNLTDNQCDSLLFALEEISPEDQIDYSILKK